MILSKILGYFQKSGRLAAPIFYLFWSSLGEYLFDHLLQSSFLHMLQITIFHAYQPYARAPDTYWNNILYSNLNRSVTYFHWKILALAGILTQNLPSSKPICYQLSYPGLDFFVKKIGYYIFFGMIKPFKNLNGPTWWSTLLEELMNGLLMH